MIKSKKAFTLIELLVVIAIIGVLATVSVIALSNARAKSRDAKRVGNMKQTQTALELFFNDNGRYPTAEEWNTGTLLSTTSSATTTYKRVIPTAPIPADGDCSENENTLAYTQVENGASYSISFCIGNTTGTIAPGNKFLIPAGIINAESEPEPEPELPLTLGDEYQGGIIFYLDGGGTSGLIAASDNYDIIYPLQQWGCYGTLIGASGTTIGTGENNTNLIVAGCLTAGIAARVCYDSVEDGYTDWFLPSNDELTAMYNNLHNQSPPLGGFLNESYLSSSEYDGDQAYRIGFINGWGVGHGDKDSVSHVVRCARSF
jgi:prepilin-type N-terminal cleavage/methylation domain-containing protein